MALIADEKLPVRVVIVTTFVKPGQLPPSGPLLIRFSIVPAATIRRPGMDGGRARPIASCCRSDACPCSPDQSETAPRRFPVTNASPISAAVFRNWTAILMRRNAGHRLEPAGDVAETGPFTVRFDLPSGRLLMTDHLHVPGFTKATTFDPPREYRELALASATGRAARARAHAAEHGMGHVQTTNTQVAVLRQTGTGRLLVLDRFQSDAEGGEWPEDAAGRPIVPGWEAVADFSCDVWRVTAVDRETAIRLMTAGGAGNAAATLDAHLASDDPDARNVAALDVAPGRWRMTGGDGFPTAAQRRRLGLPAGITAWCVLEPAGRGGTPTTPPAPDRAGPEDDGK